MTPGPRDLPSVHAVLYLESLTEARHRWGTARVSSQVAAALEEMREKILRGSQVESGEIAPEAIAGRALATLEKLAASRPRRVINATGVVVHTNLGRSVLSRKAQEAVLRAGASYSDLEIDLPSGKRGSRQDLVSDLICHLTGAEGALVVTNNAAAVLLGLRVLAGDREVLVSRGQLVEIGGSFRIPDVMAQSGARMVEVGTTNRTHLDDYRTALGPETALIMTVHPSNYRVVGFTSEASPGELVELGRQEGLPVMMDLGSGLLVPVGGLEEPRVDEMVSLGVDLVTFSGDKLLGGPQAGIMVGKKRVIQACRQHPLMRALRPDKMILAALGATLTHYLHPGQPEREIPTLEMISRSPRELEEVAGVLADQLRALLPASWKVTLEEGVARVGGGAAPDMDLPGSRVSVKPPGEEGRVATQLRQNHPPVIARLSEGRLILDPRTFMEGDQEAIVEAFRGLI